MKQVIIMLDDGTRVEIDGIVVKHIGVDGNVLYDTKKIPDVKGKAVSELPYFFLMGKSEREKVAQWFDEVEPKIDNDKKKQREFLCRVKVALNLIDYDYYIATLEPSFDKDGNIFYEEGNPVARGIRLDEWKIRAASYYSYGEWHSDLALLEEGDLFKAYRIAMGLWTIEYVCDNSSEAGNYRNSPDSIGDVELTGARKVGGFKEGIGNTEEIYQTGSGFMLVGGTFNTLGYYYPVANCYFNKFPDSIEQLGSGVLAIRTTTH